MSSPPQSQHQMPLPRVSDFTGGLPSAAGPDRIRHSFEHFSSTPRPSRYRMVYTYAPLRGGETSREKYTDGVIFVSHLSIQLCTA